MLLILADITAAMLFLSGASSPEDLSETEIERFEQLSRHRLHLNSAGRSRLIACGLFSAYQIASLEDYRSRYGDILSFTELSAVDGFGEEYAEALSYFVSLENGRGQAGYPFQSEVLLHGRCRNAYPERVIIGEKRTAPACGRFQRAIRAGPCLLERVFHERILFGGRFP